MIATEGWTPPLTFPLLSSLSTITTFNINSTLTTLSGGIELEVSSSWFQERVIHYASADTRRSAAERNSGVPRALLPAPFKEQKATLYIRGITSPQLS